ncbi:MAG: plastocyanin/azurin family copper-binding protein [Actinomycetota bacterium]
MTATKTLRRMLLLAVAVVAVAVPAAASGATKAKSLTGEVGPGFTIELKQGSKDVKTLKAGTYTIKVEDKATIHDFHLIGKGVNKSTTVPFQGTQTWKVTFKPGTYTYQCDPHAAGGMKGTFKVTK